MTTKPEYDTKEYVAPAEGANIAFVSTKTLARMADAGQIASFKLKSGHRRYLREDLEALVHGDAA
jgi:predicted site-specific integrase-resolvase